MNLLGQSMSFKLTFYILMDSFIQIDIIKVGCLKSQNHIVLLGCFTVWQNSIVLGESGCQTKQHLTWVCTVHNFAACSIFVTQTVQTLIRLYVMQSVWPGIHMQLWLVCGYTHATFNTVCVCKIQCTCADPGIFQGGSRPDGQKTVWTFLVFFLVLNLFDSLQRSNGNYTFPRIQRGSNLTSSRRSNFFPGGGGVSKCSFLQKPI